MKAKYHVFFKDLKYTISLGFLMTIGGSFHAGAAFTQVAPIKKAPVLTDRGGRHEGFVVVAPQWLDSVTFVQGFELTPINRPDRLTETYLADYDVFVRLDLPPYTWPKATETAFQQYIENGVGGWIGVHHATLLGEFDGYPLWQWFSDFRGGASGSKTTSRH